jgi:hypothetical protein
MQFCRLLSVQVAHMAVADLVAARLTQPRAVTQHLAQSQRLVGAMAELPRVVQVMVVLAVAVVTTIQVKESPSELQVKVILVVGQTAAVTELAVVAAVQAAWVQMLLRNIAVVPAV